MPDATPLISRTRRTIEIAAVLFTAGGKFVFMDWLHWRFPLIAIVIIAWSLYIIHRYVKVDGIMHYWGFRTDNFKWIVTRWWFFVPALFAVALMFTLGALRGTLNLRPEIIYVMLLYPLWGLMQQFLLIALFAGNIRDRTVVPEEKRSGRHWRIALLTSVLFAGIHAGPYPQWYWLVIGTFVLALGYSWIYLTEKNIYVLGLFHGWLGAIIFYTVVGRDVWSEVFGPVLEKPEVIRMINIVGLGFDIIGAVVMFVNSPYASSKPPIVSVPDQMSASAKHLFHGRQKEIKEQRWLRVGLCLLIFGFFLQLFSAWFG